MMKHFTIALVIGGLFFVAGCKSSDEDVANAPKAELSVDQGASGSDVQVGQKINGATAVGSPTDKIPEGGIVLRPPDPNDPKYKPDPRLGGGS